MTFEIVCSILLVPLTMALTSALKHVVPSITGKLATFLCATSVGVALSFAYRYGVPGAEPLAAWLVAARGATAAATAFGIASWPRWAADAFHTAIANAAAMQAEALPITVSMPPAPMAPPPEHVAEVQP
jgi:hypothetical protein